MKKTCTICGKDFERVSVLEGENFPQYSVEIDCNYEVTFKRIS